MQRESADGASASAKRIGACVLWLWVCSRKLNRLWLCHCAGALERRGQSMCLIAAFYTRQGERRLGTIDDLCDNVDRIEVGLHHALCNAGVHGYSSLFARNFHPAENFAQFVCHEKGVLFVGVRKN